MQSEPFQRFIKMIRSNSHKFEAQGRILRLKQYMPAGANCAAMEEVISALSVNTRVQVLYIQNFEWVRAALLYGDSSKPPDRLNEFESSVLDVWKLVVVCESKGISCKTVKLRDHLVSSKLPKRLNAPYTMTTWGPQSFTYTGHARSAGEAAD